MKFPKIRKLIDIIKPFAPDILQYAEIGFTIGSVVYAAVKAYKLGKNTEGDIPETKEIAKEMAPAIGMAIASAACGIASKRLFKADISNLSNTVKDLTANNAALATAGTMAVKALESYRNEVIDSEGKDKDLKYMYGVEKKQMDTVEYKKSGKTVHHKTEYRTFGDAGKSPFAKMFDDTSPLHTDDPVRNKEILEENLEMWNSKPEIKNMYEVCISLGIPTKPEEKKILLGTHLDYGINELFVEDGVVNPAVAAFHAGYEPNFLIDFRPMAIA